MVWTRTQKLDEEHLYNGETDDSIKNDGPQQAAESQSASPEDINVIHPLSKDHVKQLNASHAGHRDDMALLHRLGPALCEQRPRSLAVPGMTTSNALQPELPSPVMSMSPQAAYMSKIIPNAVLPPSIEVVEISRGRSRSSLRTVSKSSLLLSSPAPSRASSRASTSRTISSRTSTITSASRQNQFNLSDSSCWSNSESSDTLVSDSSTISSSSTPRQQSLQDTGSSVKEEIKKASKCTFNGKLIDTVGEVNKEGQFLRSLSVIKPKRAPPPPSRSYSLHSKKRRSRDLAEVRVLEESSPYKISAAGEQNENKSSAPSAILDSPSYHADTSSLEDSTGSGSFSPFKSQLHTLKEQTAVHGEEASSKDALQDKQENKLSKVISPSSGYSSQDAMSPHSSSLKHKKGILGKLQKLFPANSAGSARSSEKAKSTGDSVDTVNVSPSVRTLIDLFNIPPPPKIHAPPPPPPEVWAYSKRTFELLLGPPAPDNVYAIIKKNPKDRRQQRQSPSACTEVSVTSLMEERKHKVPVTVESVNGSVYAQGTKKVEESGFINAEIHKGNNDKVRVSDIFNGMLIKAVEKREERLEAKRDEAKKTSTLTKDVRTNMDTLPAISLAHISTPPHPLPKLTTEVTSVTSQNVVSPESSWPPPPPQVRLSAPDEIDFSFPPPPLFGEVVIPVQVPPERHSGGDSSCITTSATSVVNTESVIVKSNSSQAIATAPLTIPPPPPYTAPPPPLKAVSSYTTKNMLLQPKEVFPLPPKEFLPAPPEEFSLPPPKEFSPPPSTEVSLVRPTEPSRLVEEVPHPVVEDVSPVLVEVVTPSPVKEVIEDSHPPPKEISVQSSVETTLVTKLTPQPGIPLPPPLQSHLQLSEKDLPQVNIQSNSETNPVSFNSILSPPESIPPPPPIELLHQPQVVPPTTDSPATQQALPSEVPSPPAPKISPLPENTQEPAPPPPVNIPVPPPLPDLGVTSIKHQPCPVSTEDQNQELTTVHNTAQEDPTPIVTPSLLQTVKLRSINSSPEPPTAEEQPHSEVTMRKKQPSNQVLNSIGETPQKPIRRSLIVTSPTSTPTSTSPPVTVTSQPDPPKVQSLMVAPVSSTVALSPTKKSAPSTSMNMQEAIRLRTAARSKENPTSRLSLQSPTSPPLDSHRSPSSTASFIFAKSNKKVVIETKPLSNGKVVLQKNEELLPGTKAEGEPELLQKGVKVPPPVAKKPKAKGKENEIGEGMDQTAGQDGQEKNNKGKADPLV